MDTDNSKIQFVICVRNDDCGDLELRKVYEVLPDEKAAKDDYIRVLMNLVKITYTPRLTSIHLNYLERCVRVFDSRRDF